MARILRIFHSSHEPIVATSDDCILIHSHIRIKDMQKNKQYRLIYELKKFVLLHSIRYTDMFAFLTDVLWVLYKMNDLPVALALKGVLKL